MFPRFDKLTNSEISGIADSLSTLGFDDAPTAASQLRRIYLSWISIRSGHPVGDRKNSETIAHSGERFQKLDVASQITNSASKNSAVFESAASTETADMASPAWYGALQRVLKEAPLRDTVLNVVEQYVRNAMEHFDPFSLFENTPRSLDILARIACGSPFLTQTLLADPICLTSLTARGRTAEIKSREQFVLEAEAALLVQSDRTARLSELRRYQRRELLRIGMCDAFGLLDLRFVTLQLSLLADAMVQVCLNLAAVETSVNANRIAVIALGKHGGEELNYSSDIDLVIIGDTDSPDVQRLARLTIDGLAENLPPGFLYRVDLRLRPWGDAGPLVSTVNAYASYLSHDAALWEKQALLKARIVAGDANVGRMFLDRIRPLLFLESAQIVRTSIQQMKDRIEARLRQRGKLNSEVKLGVGSIRDIEFLVQCLQLTHGGREPRILSFNTLDSLVRLTEFGLLSAQWYRQLRAGYVFLRTVEHSLQLLHNQQTHELPADARQREWLANRLDYPSAETLMARFDEHRASVRLIFDACLQTPEQNGNSKAVAENSEQSRDPFPMKDQQDGGSRALDVQSAETLSAEQLRINRKVSASVRDSGLLEVHGRFVTASELRAFAADHAQQYGHAMANLPCVENEACLQLTFCSSEFPGWLSLITGLLSIHHLNIVRGLAVLVDQRSSGELGCEPGQCLAMFTVAFDASDVVEPTSTAPRDGDSFTATARSAPSVDGVGATDPGIADFPASKAAQLRDEVTLWAERLRVGGIDEVRNELISRFCDSMQRTPSPRDTRVSPAEIKDTENETDLKSTTLTPMLIDVNQNATTGETSLHVSGVDTPGFLFEMSHALSISRFKVIRAHVESIGNEVRDVLYVTEKDGRPVVNEERLQELRVTVALIKQFTHWLPSTGDPHRALLRFRELLSRLQPASHWNRDVESLRNPDVLHAVARVLGISQFLWEDFLRARYEELFPLLANTSELKERVSRQQLSLLLDECIDSSVSDGKNSHTTDAAWGALNTFKDRHLFRIDMRHVLGHCRPFGAFSEEITELAELIVQKAVELAIQQLSRDHGVPVLQLKGTSDSPSSASDSPSSASDSSRSAKEFIAFELAQPASTTRPCAFVIAGLGKCGGIEMGYASDIELMLVYEGGGCTNGRMPISNARYFELMVGAIASGISARKDGIFHVDLRMRPFGQAGSAAVTLADFETYYGPDGPCWPYERQALVKFRSIAGDEQFSTVVRAACHNAVYSAGTFEFAAMRAMRERQVRQLVRGGMINAKLSDGGLVDLEYAVQALQITFGNAIHSLRHSNTLTALNRASRMGIIDPRQRDQMEDAYMFLRELIDCLRMVRGNARDLTIPEPGSADYQQLARRMNSIHDSQISLDQLEVQMERVREFSHSVEQHCRAMRIDRNRP